MHTERLSGIAAFSTLAFSLFAFAPAASAQELEEELVPAQISFGAVGNLIVDANDPHSLIDAPTSPQAFADWKEFAEYLALNLNAEIVYDEYSAPVGWHLETDVIGQPAYFDANGAIVTTDDPSAVIIGGTTGFVVIGSQALCVNPAFCPAGQSMSLSSSQGFIVANSLLGATGELALGWTGATETNGQDLIIKTWVHGRSWEFVPCKFFPKKLCIHYIPIQNSLEQLTDWWTGPYFSGSTGRLSARGVNTWQIIKTDHQPRRFYGSAHSSHKQNGREESTSCMKDYHVSCEYCPF